MLGGESIYKGKLDHEAAQCLADLQTCKGAHAGYTQRTDRGRTRQRGVSSGDDGRHRSA